MSLNPSQSRQAKIAALVRQARAAEAANKVPETVTLLREVVQLDPHDRRTLHRLGDLFRLRLNRLREAATWYAREARAHEREDLPERALAAWRIVLACNPVHVEAHEHVGSLYAGIGRLADARQHYEKSERALREAGLVREATILRAQREALGDPELVPRPTGPAREPAPGPAAAPVPDADAVDLANERLTNGRLYHHYGLHAEARRQLEELLVLLPEHVEARQQLAEVCRALGDTGAASHHLGVLVQVMRRRGQAEVPGEAEPLDLPPVEEWDPEDGGSDPFAGFFDEVRGDVERLVDCLKARKGEK